MGKEVQVVLQGGPYDGRADGAVWDDGRDFYPVFNKSGEAVIYQIFRDETWKGRTVMRWHAKATAESMQEKYGASPSPLLGPNGNALSTTSSAVKVLLNKETNCWELFLHGHFMEKKPLREINSRQEAKDWITSLGLKVGN